MAKIKDLPKIDRPRERFLKKGPDALTKSDLLAILLGSGIKGKNVQMLAQQIISKYGKSFLNITVEKLLEINGIGQAKALQIASAISLVKRCYEDEISNDILIRNSNDILSLTYEIRDKRKEHLVCIYLDAKNSLLKKEVISIGILDKTMLHPREIFYPATEINAARIILVHNHPSGNFEPSEKDRQVVDKISVAGEIMGIPIIDFIIVSKKGYFSFYEKLKNQSKNTDYVAEGEQGTLFPLLEAEKPLYEINAETIQESYFYLPKVKDKHVQLHNRRYIGSKHKLINWIFSIVNKECKGDTFADIFAGTGIVAAIATKHFEKITINDFLYSNFAIYRAFFGNETWDKSKIESIIKTYNNIFSDDLEDNYFSNHFGGKFFSKNSAKIIGFIRENIEENKSNLTSKEYYILLASLLYSADRIANTVGHFDAYFKKDTLDDKFFLKPIDPIYSENVFIFREDANELVSKLEADIVYIDPPYNSRQYSRFYHVLETLTKWDKPMLHGVALKPEPENMSDYCRNNAKLRFSQLIRDVNANYLVTSYNNTYDPKSNSSKNKITLQELEYILQTKGSTKVFERQYRHFNAGNTDFKNHKEFLFVTNCTHDK